MRFSITKAVRVPLLGLALIGGVAPIVRAQEAPAAAKPADWRAFGRVTDHSGKLLAGVEVAAHCGVGTLRRAGVATSRTDELYVLDLGPGIAFLRASLPIPQAAIIAAHRAGPFEFGFPV
jgi:hypothetical protein